MFFKIKVTKSDDSEEIKVIEANDPVQVIEKIKEEYPSLKKFFSFAVGSLSPNIE